MSNLNPYQSPTAMDTGSLPDFRVNPASLSTARVGLYMVYYGIVSVLLACILGPIIMMAMAAGGVAALAGIIMLFLMLGIFAGVIAMLAGQVCCMTVPGESGARSMSFATVGFQVSGFIGSMASSVLLFKDIAAGALPQPGDFGWVQIIQLGSAVVGLAGFVTFIVFLKRLNVYIANQELADSASSIIKWMVWFIVCYVFFAGVMTVLSLDPNVANNGGQMSVAMGCSAMVFGLVALVVFVRYANLVLYTAKAIGALRFAG